ncbi:HD-GYP domain-containing protein [Motiliproteus sediminis]|uniref:HD-GYP domain-containing protein n=1 Tax=Motiliproteus sediminis TaxID=1468178 RepID=UPI001AF01B88|nr:HD domain-containing phosphohydrolase [Motiliproteus sediminis]
MIENSIGDTLLRIHNSLRSQFHQLCRVAVAIYDQPSDTLKTFANSTDGESPLMFYEVKLADVPSLQQLARDGKPRVLDDLDILRRANTLHSRKIVEAGYHSSYTEPLIFDDQLVGFLFFDSDKPCYFNQRVIDKLQPYAKVLAAIVAVQFAAIRTLSGAVTVAREFSRHRDEETANHLRRMSTYSRLIAKTVAPGFGLGDEEVEFIFNFSQLHDIGKIAIADAILLKPGKLTPEEYREAQAHVARGVEMAQMMIKEFGLERIRHTDMLLNIIGCHHERYDGSGYPNGLKGEAIPIEGRIVAVADVFDALTSERPYKHAWAVNDAFAYLLRNAGTQFDPVCVEAAFACAEEFKQIQARYRDEPFLPEEQSSS